EEELKKFHPSLEVEDAEEAIYNQDLTDMADLMVRLVKNNMASGAVEDPETEENGYPSDK
ncbi:MAG: hypothetical protein IJT00_03845, partial [Lachnospiraceae bacterium]|nr:hypothetical protein [Lachnospiraceae bacterium]